MATRPTRWRHSVLWFIEPDATGLPAVANTMRRWKRHERFVDFVAERYVTL